LCYFDVNKSSSLSRHHGKFDEASKLKNIFIELNRHHIKTPSAFNYSLPSIFKTEKIKNKAVEREFEKLKKLKKSRNGGSTTL
jgi:hypothetical protein